MNSISDMIYISVESRKGGVGKTTTALTLAETLLGDGYQVLMVDMDIVGTMLDSTFISSNEKVLHEVMLNGKPANLIRLFKEVFMAGKNVPAFVLEKENKDKSFTFSLGKCNYIGSNIYDTPEGNTPLEDPRILYDAFHAYWLLEFVKNISKSFATAIGGDTKVAIILDNSPGFSSIENCIHDYLTDLGPEKGKILLVSTIDPQDIEACRQSKKIIEKRFENKRTAGDYYRSLTEDGIKKEKISSDDFDSVWNKLCVSGGRQPEYHSCNHENTPSFVNILVNKVPQNIFEQLFEKDVLHKESEGATPFQNHLLYYFSNSKLAANDIINQQAYSYQSNEFYQSGKVIQIENDNNHYLKFCKISKQIGLGDFFKEEWAPMAHFYDLLWFLSGEEALKGRPKLKIWKKGDSFNEHDKVNEEIKVLERFVLSNLRKGAPLKDIIPTIEEFVSSVLNNMNDKSEIDFHPDQPKLEEIGVFVTSFGLAAYRLDKYEQICSLFNRLISFCLEDVENMEKLDKESLGIWIDNILEGRVVDQDAVGTLDSILNDRKNARELSKALQSIIRLWKL